MEGYFKTEWMVTLMVEQPLKTYNLEMHICHAPYICQPIQDKALHRHLKLAVAWLIFPLIGTL